MTSNIEVLLQDIKTHRSFADLVIRHESLEFAEDLDGALSTVCPDPLYTLMPLRWTIQGMDMLRRFYGALIPILKNFSPGRDSRAVFHGPEGVVFWDRSLEYRAADGKAITGSILAIVLRDADTGLVKGEHAFVSDEIADIFRRAVGPELDRLLTSATER